jgi:hypothetical protein
LVSFGHCVVCSSSIYGFWLPLWYLLAIVLSVLLRYTDYNYLPLVSSNSSELSLGDVTSCFKYNESDFPTTWGNYLLCSSLEDGLFGVVVNKGH